MTAVILVVASALLAAGALLAVVRLVRGPSILDRMIATDVLLTCLMLAVGMEMAIGHHTRSIPLMLVLAASAIFGTVAVARYVTKQDRAADDGATEPGERA